MITYIIIDDEPVAHKIIKSYCEKMNNMLLCANYYDALDALDYLREHTVDLIFLDINMPKLKGFELLKTLSTPPKVIVTTAYQEYALEGYELNVVDYLLKPFSFERFLKALNKVSYTKDPNTVIQEKGSFDTVFLYADKKYTQLNTEDILYVEAEGNYVKVFTTNEVLMVRDRISNICKEFPEGKFLQVHKSFVVAKQHINTIEGNRIKIQDSYIPIGKMYKTNVDQLLK